MELRAAVRMAGELLALHGLDDWTVGLDRARRRAGYCHSGHRLISLSRPLTLLHPEEEVRETILHEIAHALVGPAHGHDATWRAKAIAIGARGERCVPGDLPMVQGRFTGTCPAGHAVSRHRRPSRVASCSLCSRGFDPHSLLTWTAGEVSVRMLPAYVAELARLAESTGSAAAREQLETDAMLGGGPAHPSVAVLRTRLPPGTRVRLTPEAGRYAGRRGVVVTWSRTKYKIRCGSTVLQVPPALLAVDRR